MRKIFGTASLHWLSNKYRDRIIYTALNNGFSQFDTAGVYGLGATNKYLGSLGLSRDVQFSAKIGLTSSKTFSSFRTEILLRKIILYRTSKIRIDNCYSNWQRQFEAQMTDLGVSKFQRLLLHERYLTNDLWKLFEKFINEYKDHFQEYGVSTNWHILSPTLKDSYNKNLIIQTTPDILIDNKLDKFKKITLYG
ncbi:aldo/keto reductase, partial [Alphaproteobacteria bacterium]|nr:aldo/keto reductase [Alphaproteobacteria bacterium]